MTGERVRAIDAPDPRPPTQCRACGAENAIAIASRCARCSASLLHETCPCCGGEAGASPHRELRYVCDVCGGPRIPRWVPSGSGGPGPSRWGAAPTRAAPSVGPEAELLREADEADKARAGWKVGAILAIAIVGCVVLGLGPPLLWLGASALLLVPAGAIVAPLSAFAVLALARYRARRREVRRALDAAWLLAAGEVTRRLDPSAEREHAAQLAAILGVDEPFAEELLARVAVEDLAPVPARVATPSRLRVPDAPRDVSDVHAEADVDIAEPVRAPVAAARVEHGR